MRAPSAAERVEPWNVEEATDVRPAEFIAGNDDDEIKEPEVQH